MGAVTEIQWCDATFNGWIGCTKVGPGCDHCYAEAMMDSRFGRVEWGPGKPRQRTASTYWAQPLRWNARPFFQCEACGWRGDDELDHPKGHAGGIFTFPARRRVFCASLADVFDNEVDPAWRADLFALIASTPNLDWLLLTKRIGNAEGMIERAIFYADPHLTADKPWPWPNVWLGATVVNQEEADRDIPKLLAVRARVRFLSIEPMLGPVDFRKVPGFNKVGSAGQDLTRNLWVIAGGESGRHARPSHPDWFRLLAQQCKAAGVPFLFKQWGEWGPPPDPYPSEQQEKDEIEGKFTGELLRVGKARAGRLLDGVEHNGFPWSR